MENMENEVLNDDELYAKIETEKLLKRKKTKKIATLSSLCVAMVLAIVVIIMAAVPISLKPRCLKGGFYDVSLFSGSNASAVYQSDDEGYAKFLKLYDKAFSQTYLNALFSGSLSSYKIEELYDNTTKIDSNADVLVKVRAKAGNNKFVRLRYHDNQIFTNQNGKVYRSNYSHSLWDGTLTFSEAFIVINETAGMTETKILIIANYPTTINGEEGIQRCLLTVLVKADTNIIHNAWNDLIA